MSEDRIDEIASIRREFERAENRYDPSVQIERRDRSDFIRMPPGEPPLSRSDANESLRNLYERGGFHVEWESDGIFACADIAVDSGRFTVSFDDGRERSGSWLLAYRRDSEREWRVVRDIYNYD